MSPAGTGARNRPFGLERPVFGLLTQIPGLAGIERIAAESGHDFLVVDCQHAEFEDAAIAAITARAGEFPVLVRVGAPADPLISRLPALGAAGVIAPDVNTPPLAQHLAALCAAAGYGTDGRPVVAMIEAMAGVRDAAAIAAVAGIDILHVGCVDLSHDLGLGGCTAHPAVFDAARQVGVAAVAAGRGFGIGGDRDAGRLELHACNGARFFTTGVDRGLLAGAAADAVSRLRPRLAMAPDRTAGGTP